VTRASVAAGAMTPLEHGIFEAVNRRRALDGLRPLALDPALAAAAREHSAAMARLRFFDHTSPVRGRETPAQRAGAAHAEFVAIGENLAYLSPQIATADEFLRGWLNSPPHRKNLLDAAWENSGVGVHASRSQVHATQLFSIPPELRVAPPQFVAAGHAVLSLRASVQLDLAAELGILHRGACLASAMSDIRGRVTAQAALPTAWARHDISLAVRAQAGPWRELVGGRAAAGVGHAWEWVHERGPFAGVREWNIDLSSEAARTHHLWLWGEARRPATMLVVVDGYVHLTAPANGPFAALCELDRGGGVRQVNVGVQIEAFEYQPVHGFAVDTDRGAVALS
jgi:hypothetical protein